LISLFCPSRGRPTQAKALLDSFLATKRTEEVELVFLLDDDDPTAGDYEGHKVIGPPTGDPTGPLNREAMDSPHEYVGFIGDDSRFETPGWDEMVLQALPGIVWGDDGHDVPWPSTVFMDTKIVKAMGYMVPPDLRRGFFDVVWIELAEMTATGRVIPAMFRHDNSHRPTEPDETINADEAAYKRWRQFQARADAKKVLLAYDFARFFP
jgi:hypothetical protein